MRRRQLNRGGGNSVATQPCFAARSKVLEKSRGRWDAFTALDKGEGQLGCNKGDLVKLNVWCVVKVTG